jgi:hypothetical protein
MGEAEAVTAAPPPKAKVFEINSGGVVKPFAYKANETIEQAIAQAIQVFQLSAQPHQVGLFKSGQAAPLEPGKTLEQAAVHPGETLILKPIVVQGG